MLSYNLSVAAFLKTKHYRTLTFIHRKPFALSPTCTHTHTNSGATLGKPIIIDPITIPRQQYRNSMPFGIEEHSSPLYI